MKKKTFNITSDALLELGITPLEGVEYLERKKANTIHPVHVTALLLLKLPVASS